MTDVYECVDEICRYCGRVGPDVCDTPPVDVCERAIPYQEQQVTDPNTTVLTTLAFAANSLIEVRDDTNTGADLAFVVSNALAYVQAGLIMACGQPSESDAQTRQQANEVARQQAQQQASWYQDGPNRG